MILFYDFSDWSDYIYPRENRRGSMGMALNLLRGLYCLVCVPNIVPGAKDANIMW